MQSDEEKRHGANQNDRVATEIYGVTANDVGKSLGHEEKAIFLPWGKENVLAISPWENGHVVMANGDLVVKGNDGSCEENDPCYALVESGRVRTCPQRDHKPPAFY